MDRNLGLKQIKTVNRYDSYRQPTNRPSDVIRSGFAKVLIHLIALCTNSFFWNLRISFSKDKTKRIHIVSKFAKKFAHSHNLSTGYVLKPLRLVMNVKGILINFDFYFIVMGQTPFYRTSFFEHTGWLNSYCNFSFHYFKMKECSWIQLHNRFIITINGHFIFSINQINNS